METISDSITQSFTERFTASATAHADRPAVSLGGRTIYTYAQLISRAHAVAARLTELGTGPEVVVGLAMPKSPQYIAAMLGIWFSGAAFVPLDPTLPSDNLEYRCKQANVSNVIVPGQGVDTGQFAGARTIIFETIKDAPDNFEPSSNSPSDLAYIIFTSGSTGRPKGVMVEHRGLVNFIDAQIESFVITAQSRCLWMLSTNFDASVSDLGTALLAGANLFIEPTCELEPRAGLEEKLAELEITHIDIPPSVLRLMDAGRIPACLETIVIGGEACAPDVVREYAAKLRLVNVYGPTESTVCTSLGRCHVDWQRPLIGQPLPGVFYFVLDEKLEAVLPGDTGELYIGGVQLARGYVGQEDLTAQRFIFLESVDRGATRLYKTGDVIKLCEDGEYQFVGRSDRQFKLRGMLIEPEEIEARLLQHPGVERAAVLKRALSKTSDRVILVAYYSGSAHSQELKQYLKDCLPAWMVPQRLEQLGELPLTITGKIDLSALALATLTSLPIKTLPPNISKGAANQADLKCLLQGIWQNILGIEPQDEDNFFDLGGDSFAVVEAVVAAQAHGINISPALFLANLTLDDLVSAIAQKGVDSEKIIEVEAMSAEFLRQDIGFDDEQTALLKAFSKRAKKTFVTKPQNILLTGATGFLGARLLAELLRTTDAHIHCLVRGENGNNDSAIKKIAAALTTQNLPLANLNRVSPVFGRLDARCMGMAGPAWEELSDKIDTIFHSGARVNMLDSYEQLRESNVQGTWEIVRLMLAGRPKVLHYASTLSVFVATDKNRGLLKEDDNLNNTSTIYGGYAQSKWAAEVMLRNLQGQAGPITYHRLGLITGDSKSGHSSNHDFLGLFVQGLGRLGCAPRQSIEATPELAVDITPVDYAAAAMCKLSLTAMAGGLSETYHIAGRGGLTLKNLLTNMEASGLPVALVEAAEFKERLLTAADSLGPTAAACLALCRGLGDDAFASFRSMDLFQATDVQFSQINAQRDLAGSGIICPEPDERLIQLYIAKSAGNPSARAAPP